MKKKTKIEMDGFALFMFFLLLGINSFNNHIVIKVIDLVIAFYLGIKFFSWYRTSHS